MGEGFESGIVQSDQVAMDIQKLWTDIDNAEKYARKRTSFRM
jgi:hypothetical protein